MCDMRKEEVTPVIVGGCHSTAAWSLVYRTGGCERGGEGQRVQK